MKRIKRLKRISESPKKKSDRRSAHCKRSSALGSIRPYEARWTVWLVTAFGFPASTGPVLGDHRWRRSNRQRKWTARDKMRFIFREGWSLWAMLSEMSRANVRVRPKEEVLPKTFEWFKWFENIPAPLGGCGVSMRSFDCILHTRTSRVLTQDVALTI